MKDELDHEMLQNALVDLMLERYEKEDGYLPNEDQKK